jgi:hypothetical protein
MKTLKEKKNQIFEFLYKKRFKATQPIIDWLVSLNIFIINRSCLLVERFAYLSNDSNKKKLTLPYHLYHGWGASDYKKIKFKEVKQFIQKTLLEDTYIKVNNERESKWVQELLFSVGYEWCTGWGKQLHNLNASTIHIFNNGKEFGTREERCDISDCYEISISYLETLFDTKFPAEEKPKNKEYIISAIEAGLGVPKGFTYKVQVPYQAAEHFEKFIRSCEESERTLIRSGFTKSANGKLWVPPVNEYASKYHILKTNHDHYVQKYQQADIALGKQIDMCNELREELRELKQKISKFKEAGDDLFD